jgi:WD40 repeat protein
MHAWLFVHPQIVRVWCVQDMEGPVDGPWCLSATLEETQTGTIRSSEFSPCGRFLASASFDATVAIWELQDGEWECVANLEGHDNEVKSVAWSPSGALLATCSRDKSVWIWTTNQGVDIDDGGGR